MIKIGNLESPSKNIFNTNAKKTKENFADFLKESVGKVNQYELESEKMDNLAAIGQIDNMHETMIASGKSEIALQFMLEVKSKVLDAYKQIMRLQV